MTWLLVALLATVGSDAPGIAAFTEGRFHDALGELDAAVETGLPASSLAQAHLLRGRCFAALQKVPKTETAFEAALSADPEVRLDAEDVPPPLVGLLEALRQRLKGTLSVVLHPPGTATLRVDGSARGALPWRSELSIGRHWIEVRGAAGELLNSQSTVVRRDGITEIDVQGPASQELSSDGSSFSTVNLLGSLRTEADVRGGLAVEVGGGIALSRFLVTGELTIGAGLGATLRAGARLPLYGPLGALVSLDGVMFVTPTTVPGGGATAELFWAYRHLELFAAVSGRWFSVPAGIRSSYGLVGIGVRLFAGTPR
jgi:hypothetical protein